MTDNPDRPAATGGSTDSPPLTTAGTLIERMGIVVVETTAERVVATMPLTGNTQPYGLLHGGASCVLAETVGSLAAALHAHPLGKVAAGIEINASHHRAVRAGTVTGTATAVSLGTTLACYDVVILDAEQRRVCTARITCALLERPPGADRQQPD
jgi:1,4-dihydroxy-2-naphthoyl-CoA hydrolase